MLKPPETPFYRDVLSQPSVLHAALARYERDDRSRLNELASLLKGRWLGFVGMGSSLYAPYPATLWLGRRGVWATTVDASEALHYPTLPDAALPILVSQSGESVELVRLADRWKGREYVAITNDPDSSMARHATITLPIYAGPEAATSSKTYVNTVAVSLLAAAAIEGRTDAMMQDLRGAAEALGQALDAGLEPAALMAQKLGRDGFLDVVARGPALSAAQQASLILRESCGALGACHSGGLLRHGPIHDIGEGRRALLFISRGRSAEMGLRLAADLLERGATVGVVTDQESMPAHEKLTVFRVPPVEETAFSIPAIVAPELLGCFWAAEQGIEPGERVEKVTRVE